MSDQVERQAKNIKQYYVPRTAVVYFSEAALTVADNLSHLVVEHTQFFQIGPPAPAALASEPPRANANRFQIRFLNWLAADQRTVSSPGEFFNRGPGRELSTALKDFDLVVVVFKSGKVKSLEYVQTLVGLLKRHDVLAFHYVIESLVLSIPAQKLFTKLTQTIKSARQVHVEIREAAVVDAYKQATITNRNHYINLYTNHLIESFLAPFLDPAQNEDHFSKVKALFYEAPRSFETKVISSIGYSEAATDYLDLALVQALANPIFAGAFQAARSFIVSIKTPLLSLGMAQRIEAVFHQLVGPDHPVLVASYLGAYDYDLYCQVTILALNVDLARLNPNPDLVSADIKAAIAAAPAATEVFRDPATRDHFLDHQIEILDDPAKTK